MRTRWRHRSLILVLLVAFGLRLAQLTFQPLWFDEGWSVWFGVSSLPKMLERTALDIHPPLYYALLHGWIALADHGEFALRLLSVLTGVLLVALVYPLARGLLGDLSARLALVMTALSPLQIFYAQEVRMYGLVTALGLASSGLFWRALHGHSGRPARRMWIAYAVVTAAAMYAEYYGAFIPLFHGIYWLWQVRGRVWRRPSALGAFAFAGLLYLPWVVYASSKLAAYVGDKVGIEQYAVLPPWDYAARHLIAFAAGHLTPDTAWLGWIAVVFAALALWGIAAARTPRGGSQSPRPALFLTLYLLVPFVAAYLVQMGFPFAPPRMERLLLLASPPFLMLAARGLTAFIARAWALRSWAALAGTVLTGAVMLAASALSLASFYNVPRYPEQDYRPLAERMDALSRPGDRVIAVHPWQVGFLRAYLTSAVDLQPAASPAWGAEVRAQIDEALDAHRRIWVPAYQSLGRVLETEMENHLKAGALSVESKWYGDTRLLFYAPIAPALTFEASGTPAITVGTDRATSAWEAGWGIVPLQMTLDFDEPARTPRISLRLKDEAGVVWAAQDREFDSMETSGAIRRFRSAAGFLVPAGTPPGAYRISLGIYDAQSLQSLRPERDVLTLRVSRPAVPPSIAALPIQTPLTVGWPGMRLLGLTLRDGAWRGGETLHLDLFWQATDSSLPGRVLFAQMQGPDGKPYAVSETPPRIPTTAWQRGDLYREQRDLQLPANLPAGTYRVAIGWFDERNQSRVPHSGGDNQFVLREITVTARPRQMTPPAMQARNDLRFGDVARIAGHDLALDPQRKTATARLYWLATSETPAAYKVFVHIVPAGATTPLAQHDSPPAGGALPTTAWLPGEYITDEHVVALPDNMPPGPYRILVGLYDPQSGARVPAFAPDGQRFPNDAVILTSFEWR
ncbi:MAG: glycosyltransferase family 39 protein [Chloroflexi bacterium]|nr:glycosyltransferase family 39 protein [Chloroflexota bacterium]